MTWRNVFERLKDPIIFGGLVLLITGEIQAQADALLSWLGPIWAGRVLSLIGLLGILARAVQTLPPRPIADTHTRAEHAASDHDGTDQGSQ